MNAKEWRERKEELKATNDLRRWNNTLAKHREEIEEFKLSGASEFRPSFTDYIPHQILEELRVQGFIVKEEVRDFGTPYKTVVYVFE